MNNREIISLLRTCVREHFDNEIKNTSKEDLTVYKGLWVYQDYDKINSWLTTLKDSLDEFGFNPTQYKEKQDTNTKH